MLNERIFYRAYGDSGYVLNMNTGRSYFFEDVGAAVLKAAAVQGETDPARITELLAQEYELPSMEQVQDDVAGFLNMLKNEGILISPSTAPAYLPEDYLVTYCRGHYREPEYLLCRHQYCRKKQTGVLKESCSK